MWRRYSGYCYDGHHKVYFAWNVSCALQKQVMENFWLDHGLARIFHHLLK